MIGQFALTKRNRQTVWLQNFLSNWFLWSHFVCLKEEPVDQTKQEYNWFDTKYYVYFIKLEYSVKHAYLPAETNRWFLLKLWYDGHI